MRRCDAAPGADGAFLNVRKCFGLKLSGPDRELWCCSSEHEQALRRSICSEVGPSKSESDNLFGRLTDSERLSLLEQMIAVARVARPTLREVFPSIPGDASAVSAAIGDVAVPPELRRRPGPSAAALGR